MPKPYQPRAEFRTKSTRKALSNDIVRRRCPGCTHIFPSTPEYFHVAPAHVKGRAWAETCRSCYAEAKERRAARRAASQAA